MREQPTLRDIPLVLLTSNDCTSEAGKGSSFRFVVMLRSPDSAAVFNRAQRTLKKAG